MITFFNDALVPPELCRLLYQSVPEDLHVPIVFHNRRAGYFASGRRALGVTMTMNDRVWIEINLNRVYADARGPGSQATVLWERLLGVCYHEFGHVATRDQVEEISDEEYDERGGAYYYVERLANEWRDGRLATLLSRDTRLGQPRIFTGYLGARLSRDLKWAKGRSDQGGSTKAMYVRERRFMKTGGQFSSTDALRRIHFPVRSDATFRRALKRLCPDIGIDYVDGAGRHHQFFHWGDLPIVRARLEAASHIVGSLAAPATRAANHHAISSTRPDSLAGRQEVTKLSLEAIDPMASPTNGRPHCRSCGEWLSSVALSDKCGRCNARDWRPS